MAGRVQIGWTAYFLWAVMLLTLPLRWIAAAAAAALIHELGHLLMVYLCGGRIWNVEIGTFGARMDAEPMQPFPQLLCSLAGPAASLLLLLFAGRLPRIAFCGAVQGLYNLLPIAPLDGSRALRCFAAMLSSETKAERICTHIEVSFLCLLAAAGLAAAFFLRLGLVPVLVCLVFLGKNIKIPCKQAKQIVQ